MDYFYKSDKSFYVEPTTRCNYDCKMCFEKFEKQDLTFEQFKIIVEKTNLDFVKLWGRGEPFLNKDIYKILEFCHQKNIKTFITSNFSLIDLNEEAIKCIDMLCVSLHASNSKIYELVTGSLEFEKVIENIKKFRKINSDIFCKSVISSINEKDIDDFKQLCNKLQTTCILTGLDFPTDIDLEKLVDLYPVSKKVNINYNRYLPYSLKPKNSSKKCLQPHWPMILATGDIFTCCKRPKTGFLGNVFENFKIDKLVIEQAKNRKLLECQECTIQ